MCLGVPLSALVRSGLVQSNLVRSGLISSGPVCPGLPWSGLVWLGLVCSGVVWLGLAWSTLVWLGLPWSGLVWSGLVYLGLPWFDLVQSSPVRCGFCLGLGGSPLGLCLGLVCVAVLYSALLCSALLCETCSANAVCSALLYSALLQLFAVLLFSALLYYTMLCSALLCTTILCSALLQLFPVLLSSAPHQLYSALLCTNYTLQHSLTLPTRCSTVTPFLSLLNFHFMTHFLSCFGFVSGLAFFGGGGGGGGGGCPSVVNYKQPTCQVPSASSLALGGPSRWSSSSTFPTSGFIRLDFSVWSSRPGFLGDQTLDYIPLDNTLLAISNRQLHLSVLSLSSSPVHSTIHLCSPLP